MNTISSLNSQIASLRSSISSMNQQLNKKREELERLNRAQSQLLDCQSDFNSNQHLCLKPELTPTTWHGKLAGDYDLLRENELQASYIVISDEQLQNALAKLAEKIQEIKQEIRDLEASISSQNASLSSLINQRRREFA
ncbi:YwqH-like family protein [Lentibacillus sp. Marseille-P4043]|uniref:YwqH-like family protein n=1 Tax=Lentibacillus sp. Marseille-P4043 TaxID=2040293 RepID=UPI00131A5DFB|nr:DUF5082 family protein [Lentibacillus sp. Marseille-P4043]